MESSDTIECLNEEQIPGWDFAHMQNDMNLHIGHMLDGTFLLDGAQIRKIHQFVVCHYFEGWVQD